MSALRPGTARGDRSVYVGRECVGYVRGSVSAVYAYSADGKPLGTYADSKAAVASLMARAAGKEVAK